MDAARQLLPSFLPFLRVLIAFIEGLEQPPGASPSPTLSPKPSRTTPLPSTRDSSRTTHPKTEDTTYSHLPLFAVLLATSVAAGVAVWTTTETAETVCEDTDELENYQAVPLYGLFL